MDQEWENTNRNYMNEWMMDEWMNEGWMNEWMIEWMNEWMNEWMFNHIPAWKLYQLLGGNNGTDMKKKIKK